MESKPKSREKEIDLEAIEQMGNLALSRESRLQERHGRALKLTTTLALLMSMNVFAGQAEAGGRFVGPQGNWVRQAVSETVSRGVFDAASAMDRRRAQEKSQLDAAYNQAMSRLNAMKSEAYSDFVQNKISKEEYEKRKAEAEMKIAQVQRAYQEELKRQHGFRRGVFETILRGVQGY